MNQISPHFTEEELTHTHVAGFADVQAHPPAFVQANLRRLCALLEALRVRWGPVRIQSGWRSYSLNQAVHGAPDSLHLDGLAADCVLPRLSLVTAVLLASSGPPLIPYDELILEAVGLDAWLHVQAPRKPGDERRSLLMSFDGLSYSRFDVKDPRLTHLL